MPNRILRDWTDSEDIDKIDVNAERFFTRLIMKVDDFGRYNANVKLLKSHLFPLKSDIRETDIARWLTACEKSGLIVLYNVANKEYLQIENFNQTLRQKKEKYPSPDIGVAPATQMHSTRMSEEKGKETETEKKPKVSPPPLLNEVIEYFLHNGYSEEAAKKAFQYYDSNFWKDSKGNKVLSWKQKMISVWFKPENKIPAGSDYNERNEQKANKILDLK